jgi:hypothetical protein
MSNYGLSIEIINRLMEIKLHLDGIKERIRLVRYVHEFLLCLPKDYTCVMCS